MGTFDNELTLPGVITEILPTTINFGAGSEFGTTEAVTIIGVVATFADSRPSCR